MTEFSRIVDVGHLGREEARHDIAAEAAERAALASRFGIPAVERLTAEVRLARSADGLVRLSAELDALVVQECVITLEPIATSISERFTLLFGAVAEEAEVELDGEAETIEPLDDGAIDIGEAVAQQLSLALDPFPRAPGAEEALAATQDDEKAESPFAVLADWRAKNGKTRDG